MTYIIKKASRANITLEDREFIMIAAEEMNTLYKSNYDWSLINFVKFLDEDLLLICYRDKEPVGFLAASFYASFFDPTVKILQQNLLYARPGTRAAYLLLKEFVDFGKVNAKHTISMIAENTNIKPSSLEKLGFKKLETLYRLEA